MTAAHIATMGPMSRVSSTSSLALACTLFALIGCGGDADTPDAASVTSDAFVPEGTDAWSFEDAPLPDGGPFDAGTTNPDAAVTACTPTSGPLTGDGYCDLLELAILEHGDSAEVQLYGRLSPEDAVGCTVVDEVEVFDGGASIGTIDGIGPFTAGTQNALLARGAALAPMIDRCGGDEGRFESYGLILRGRYDGGSFEARCAASDSGSRWPPALRVTCHENLDRPPTWANAMLMSFMGSSSAQVSFMIPHDAGAAVTAVTPPVRILSYAAVFPPGPMAPEPFDVADFVSSVSEGSTPSLGAFTTVNLFSSRDPFGTTLCPASPTMPMPGDPVPPAMLLRVSGTSERGPIRTEVYVQTCTRPSI